MESQRSEVKEDTNLTRNFEKIQLTAKLEAFQGNRKLEEGVFYFSNFSRWQRAKLFDAST
jgi:hypothetical protein